MGKAKKSKVSKKQSDAAFTKKKKKVGKKVLKSNETYISIKTRKIALPVQHEAKDNQLVFKGKSVSEYITGTKHTNSNQRVQNLVNLQDMVSNNLYLIEPNAGALIERLGVVLQDPEENVRSSALVLVKTVLNHIKSDDLLPFLQVFIAQLSSGMLHIDKGVQKTTVFVLLCLFQNHLANAMNYSDSLLSSLITLLSANKNKNNILMYFQAISHILKFYVKSDENVTHSTLKQSSVPLYRYALRQQPANSQPRHNELLKRMCECALPHLHTIWLEDAPSQVYAQAEPNVLRTCTSLIHLLILFHKSDLNLSKAALIKLNNIGKSVSSRFPLVCSVPNRDTALLRTLNLKISQFLVLIERYSKVERYFVSYFKSRLQELSSSEVSDSLTLISQIPRPDPGTLLELQDHTLSPHSSLFLSHFVRAGWLQSVDLKNKRRLTKCLEDNIGHVAADIINTFYAKRGSVVVEIFVLCLDKKVFSSLSEPDQIKCLELYYHYMTDEDMPLTSKSISDIGQAAKTQAARSKFYSVLLSMFHEDKVSVEDYISILLTQANRDDEATEGSEPDFLAVTDFTSQLLTNFDILPAVVRENLFQITLPQIVERLYSGLSHFSLAAYLWVLRKFYCYSRSKGSEVEMVVSEDHVVRLAKIICSLIFNKDSLSDWGSDIVKLAVKLSIEHHVIFRYVTESMDLENKSVDILLWYLKIALRCSRDITRDNQVGIEKLFGFLKSRISDSQRREMVYRVEMAFTGP